MRVAGSRRVGKGALCAVPTDRGCRPAHRNGGHAIDRAFARPLSFAHPTVPLRRKSILTHIGERRDPYAVSSLFGIEANTLRKKRGQGLWVPAFAGTTWGEIASLTSLRGRG